MEKLIELLNEYEENKKLKSDLWTVIDERDNAFKKIKELEEENKKLKGIIGNIVYLYKEEPTELWEYVKSWFKCWMSN